MDRHPLSGHDSVDESAQRIRNYRYVEERLMRTMGGWIALTPEVPAKLLLGRHVWECAQHADLWGRRLPELRSPAQKSEPANERVGQCLDLLESAEGPDQTPERLAGVYQVLKPHLVAVYERHLARANAVFEPPTRRILERCLDEERRHVAAGAIVFAGVVGDPARRQRAIAWESGLLAALARAGGALGDGFAATAPLTSHPGADGDVVALTNAFTSAAMPADLAEAVDRHRRALEVGDLGAAEQQVMGSAREMVAREYMRLTPPPLDSEVVALARIGEHRMVKLAFRGPHGTAVVQQRWRRAGDGWCVFGAELVRVEPAP